MKIASRSRNTYKEFNPRSTKVESEWVVRGPLSWLGDLGEGSGEGSRGPPGCPGCNDFSPATGETLGWDCHGPSTVAHGLARCWTCTGAQKAPTRFSARWAPLQFLPAFGRGPRSLRPRVPCRPGSCGCSSWFLGA